MVKDNKKKLVAGAVAGVAALALIGGGTFALWSDFDTVEGNNLAAGTLVLDVGESTSLDMGNLAPGENKATTLFIANRGDDTAALQDAQLSATFENLRDIEDGCVSNSEKEEDSTCGSGSGNNNGEFSEEAYLQLRVSPAATAGQCASGSPKAWKKLADYFGTSTDLGTLDPGQGICVKIEAGLPSGEGNQSPPPGIDAPTLNGATNASQGDSATFDVRFDLVQNVPS